MRPHRPERVAEHALIFRAVRALQTEVGTIPPDLIRAFDQPRTQHVRPAGFLGPGPFGERIPGPAGDGPLPARRRAPLLLVRARALAVLGGVDVRAGELRLEPGHGSPGDAQGPRVAEPAPVGPLAGVLGLVAVERAGLDSDRPRAHGGDRHGALEDLRQVMVRGIEQRRTAHRVVGAERRKALAGAERHYDPAVQAPQHVRAGEHQLVDVGMRMAAVIVALAVGTGGELAVADGPPLEVAHGMQLQVTPKRGGIDHQDRLHQSRFAAGRAAGNGVRGGDEGNRLAGEAQRGTLGGEA